MSEPGQRLGTGEPLVEDHAQHRHQQEGVGVGPDEQLLAQHLELLHETGGQAEPGGIKPVAFGTREVGIAVEPVTDADHGGRVRSDDVVHLRGVDLAIE